MSALARLLPNPYGEVPSAIRWLLLLETVLVWVATIWLVVLFVRALREKGRRDAEDLPVVVPDGLLWIFLVPALDEEVTIRDSVSRLIGLGLRNSVVVVIDDGSTDATPAILREMAWPSLAVLRRDLPDARRGKAAALNAGWRYVHRNVLGPGGRVYQGWSADRVVVVVVDADGRLHPESIAATAGLFTDPRVGGVQTLVRIYNRRTFLTWCQDVEFAIFGRLYQLGRSPWGTAGMGGNGQFNRLSALDSVADRVGPWRDTLTEDQDLGLRLIGAGWHGRQESRVGVDQQGLNSLRRLLRQRTRWAQGNLQAMRRLGTAMRADIDAAARVDLVFVLFLPIIQLIVSVGLVVTVCAFLFADVPLWGGALWITFLFYGITFGSGLLGLVCRAPRITPEVVIKAALLSLAYALYAWLIVPALVRAVFRQATGRGSWMKTAREAIGEPHG